jgi:hypothetical protein
MAIQKTKVVNGVSGNFWKTREVYISPDKSHSRVTIALYVSQAAYLSGAVAIDQQDIALSGVDHPFMLSALAEIAEKKLITLSGDLSGGTFVSGL